MSLACTLEARRGALRIPPFLDVGRQGKPVERSTRIGLAVCLTSDALECFSLNVSPRVGETGG